MSNLTEADIRAAVLSELEGQLSQRGLSGEQLSDDVDLIAEGVIDSFGMLELIGALEARFGLAIDFEDIDAADLTVIGSFSRYVAAHGSRGDGQAGDAVATLSRRRRSRRQARGGRRSHDARLGRAALRGYRMTHRIGSRTRSLLWAGSFASFGSNSAIEAPIRLVGEARMSIGSGVSIGSNAWLQVIDGYGEGVALWIGDRVSIARHCVLSAVTSIRAGDAVTLGGGVYVADHTHAYSDSSTPVADQGITDVNPVEIGDGAWIGENAVILPGVRIGRGAMVGANSVVARDVPDHTAAAGVPARLLPGFA